ncbi:MAG: aminodeoxychorismate/anthranilate synthase component II [Pseudomonadota bacterium]
MIILIDNYDSFVQTLARYLREAGAETMVIRNDAATVADISALSPRGLLLSPGPGRPEEAGISMKVIKAFPTTPILGVCLGHQALVAAYGGSVIYSPDPMHGRASAVVHRGDDFFEKVDSPFFAGRYHSLLGHSSGASDLGEIAWTKTGEVMAVRHRIFPHIGVQFHPESLLTPSGPQMIQNFLTLQKESR